MHTHYATLFSAAFSSTARMAARTTNYHKQADGETSGGGTGWVTNGLFMASGGTG